MYGGVIGGGESGSLVKSLWFMSARARVVGEVGLISLGSSTWFGGISSFSSGGCWVILVLIGGGCFEI
jgi:hypothetical protein